jgi:hypothetical protein
VIVAHNLLEAKGILQLRHTCISRFTQWHCRHELQTDTDVVLCALLLALSQAVASALSSATSSGGGSASSVASAVADVFAAGGGIAGARWVADLLDHSLHGLHASPTMQILLLVLIMRQPLLQGSSRYKSILLPAVCCFAEATARARAVALASGGGGQAQATTIASAVRRGRLQFFFCRRACITYTLAARSNEGGTLFMLLSQNAAQARGRQ